MHRVEAVVVVGCMAAAARRNALPRACPRRSPLDTRRCRQVYLRGGFILLAVVQFIAFMVLHIVPAAHPHRQEVWLAMGLATALLSALLGAHYACWRKSAKPHRKTS